MKKFVAGTLLGFGMLVATATSATAAPSWSYTGYWYHTRAACEAGYQKMVSPGSADLPHECRAKNGVYELWRMH